MKNEVCFRVRLTKINGDTVIFESTTLSNLEEKIEVHKIRKNEIESIQMTRVIPELVKQPKIKLKKESIIQQWRNIIDPEEYRIVFK